MPQVDNFSWNFAIKAFSAHGDSVVALQFSQHMFLQGFCVDKYILASILGAVMHQSILIAGLCAHACIHNSDIILDSAVCTALITMYGNCHHLRLAKSVFENMSNHDIITWTAMIEACAQCGNSADALYLLNNMIQQGLVPDLVTLVSSLDACAGLTSRLQCKMLHVLVLSCSVDSNLVIGTALINMYGKTNSLTCAQRVFQCMAEHNVVTWNALIGSFAQNGRSHHAFQSLEQMLQEGVLPNKVTFVNGINACVSSLSITIGIRLHACIERTVFGEDIVIQTALINMYGECGLFVSACRIFENMHEHDEVALVNILSACASDRALAEGKKLHSYVIFIAYESHIIINTALINMYNKCGSLKDARRVFDRMPKRNVISWNAIIAAYCQNGMGRHSLLLYKEMKSDNVNPNDVTFLSILSACSHAGLFEQGLQVFDSMKHAYHIVPNVDHYNCIIDSFGRMGKLMEAENLILNMPLEPNVTSWTTLLSACRKETDVERGERAAFRLFDINPQDTVPYVMLANIYAAAGRPNDADHVMALMRGKGLRLEP